MSIMLAVLVICILPGASVKASAESGISVTLIDYDKSQITLKLTGTDTRVYISDAKMKKWEYVPAVKADDGTVSFDISWISVTKDYTLSIKGDVSTDPVQVMIPKQENKFKVTYDVSTGNVNYLNNNDRPVQWRKKNGSTWTDAGTADQLKEVFSKLIGNGASIVFRLAPRNGSGTDGGLRPSKEVTVTIPKKTTAPKITVNNSNMTLAVVKGLEYRYIDENGIPVDLAQWIVCEKAENIALSVIAPNAVYADDIGNEAAYPENTSLQDQYIQFRLQAGKAKQMSNNTTVKIPAQVLLSQEEIDSFKFEYKSSSSFAITASKASESTPYEYCIINTSDSSDGVSINTPEKLKWKEITDSDEIYVSNTKNSCDNGSKIYIRRKAVNNLGDDDYKLGSNIYKLQTINYPGNVTADENCSMSSIAGVCRKENSDGNLSFSFFSPTNGVITSLKFGKDADNMKELDSSDFESEYYLNTGANSEEFKYIIHTTIFSTAALESYIESGKNSVELTGIYSIGNSTEYCSIEESLVKLTLYRASKVIIPDDSLKTKLKEGIPGMTDADRIGYTKTIRRVYMSTRVYGEEYQENADQDVFRTVIKLGNPDQTVNVREIQYDGIVLNDTNFDTFQMTDEASENKDKYLVIQFYAAEIEQNPNITTRDKSAQFTIKLDNDEKLTDVTMILLSSAKLKQGSSGVSINPDLIEEERTVTSTVNGVVSTWPEPNRDYYIEYEVNISGYEGLLVTNAIYKNKSIFLENDSANGKVYLSVKKIKEIAEDATTTLSGNVEIIFNNGFKITRGYNLILTK